MYTLLNIKFIRNFSSDPRKFRRKKSNPFMVAGIPMLLFLGGGLFGLSHFMGTHMELKDKKVSSQSVRQYSIEEEREKMIAKLDIENYTLSRIPRPGEETDGEASGNMGTQGAVHGFLGRQRDNSKR
jgi:hypothetical protein